MLPINYQLIGYYLSAGKIWALQYDNGEEVALLYTEKDTVRSVFTNLTNNTDDNLPRPSVINEK